MKHIWITLDFIPEEERLPDKNDDLLILHANGVIEEAEFDINSEWSITHWAKIPTVDNLSTDDREVRYEDHAIQ